MARLVATFALIKGAIMGPTVVAVIHSGLSPFAQAVVVAVISASIGAMGMVAAAVLSARAVRETAEVAKRNESKLDDVKRTLGADRRDQDA